MPFFSTTFAESLAPAESSNSRDGYINPSSIGKTLPNPLRLAILSEAPLEGYEIWFDKADGSKTKRVAAGNFPTPALLAEYETLLSATVAKEVDFDTKQPTNKNAIKKCTAFFVYDYDAESVKVLSYSQVSLLKDIERKTADPDYADLTKWDLQINKVTVPKISYSADMKPSIRQRDPEVSAKITAAWDEAVAAGANIMRLTDGGNPFSSK
jgi:hypothetical protein